MRKPWSLKSGSSNETHATYSLGSAFVWKTLLASVQLKLFVLPESSDSRPTRSPKVLTHSYLRVDALAIAIAEAANKINFSPNI